MGAAHFDTCPVEAVEPLKNHPQLLPSQLSREIDRYEKLHYHLFSESPESQAHTHKSSYEPPPLFFSHSLCSARQYDNRCRQCRPKKKRKRRWINIFAGDIQDQDEKRERRTETLGMPHCTARARLGPNAECRKRETPTTRAAL